MTKILTLALCLVSVSASAQSLARSLTIGDVELTLGMSKARVLTALSKQYSVDNSGQFVSGAEFWFVKVKGSSHSVGNVRFKNDLLVGATKGWDEIDANEVATRFMKNLYGAIEAATKETKMGRVHYQVQRKPDSTLHAIIFYFGIRSVILSVNETKLSGQPYSAVDIEESVDQ